ncbi:unnamed protein product [Colias eurytheme]|nr:unnamed protein product [Colias eurytheme]
MFTKLRDDAIPTVFAKVNNSSIFLLNKADHPSQFALIDISNTTDQPSCSGYPHPQDAKDLELITEHIHICTLNTRTLRTEESLKELEIAISNIKWDILGISEMRRPGEGIEEKDDYILFHKGEHTGQKGVGFLIKSTMKKNILGFEGVSDRIAAVHLKFPGYRKNWAIFQIYAPTEHSGKSDIDYFYDCLAEAIKPYYNKNIIIMGDFNAQVGEKQIGEEFVIGRKNLANNDEPLKISEISHHNNPRTTESFNEIITSDAETGIKYERLQNKLKDMLISKPKRKESYLSKETMELLDERRALLSNKGDRDRRQKISNLSKKIKENMRDDRKKQRNRVLEENIKRTGGAKKAMKQLSEHGKEWIPKLKQRESHLTNRLSIQKLASDYYRRLYTDPGKDPILEAKETNGNTVDEVPEILASEILQ